MTTPTSVPAAPATDLPAPPTSFLGRLTSGTANIEIVARRKIWYVGFALVLLACIGSMVFKGFNPGIDFAGGTQIQVTANGANGPISVGQVEAIFEESVGRAPSTIQAVGSGDSTTIVARSTALTEAERVAVSTALFDELQPLGRDGRPDRSAVSDTQVSSSWGGGITRQALIALTVFLVLVTLFLTFYFEARMAVAALLTLTSNIVITAGIFSMTGLQVTPTTIVGLLAILGFSLYDTVVVFDKVRENSRNLLDLSRRTYAEAANQALNQTLMRSINTSIISSLPLVGLLVIGVGLLGVGTLADLAVVYLVGVLVDTVSSIFLATPLLVDLKMRDGRYQEQAERVRSRRATASRRAGSVPATDDGSGAESRNPDENGDREVRREKALTAAAGVPARTGKTGDRRDAADRRPSGQRDPGQRDPGQRQSGQRQSGQRQSGQRPTGKRRR